MHCLQKSPYFKDLVLNKDLFGILGPYWVLIYIPGSLFSLYWVHSRKECQFSLIFAGIGSSLQCQQILILTYAYALIFIHRCFGSLFWLLGVLVGSLFHQKMGPYWVLISKLGGPYQFWGQCKYNCYQKRKDVSSQKCKDDCYQQCKNDLYKLFKYICPLGDYFCNYPHI